VKEEGGERTARLSVDFNDLARSNGIDVRKTRRQENQQVFEASRFGPQNHDGDVSASQILLVFNALIHGKENIKFGRFRRLEKFTIFQPRQSGVTSCLAVVGRQRIPESLINTFVEQNAHLGTCKQKMLRLLECGEGRFARDGRKAPQKFFEAISTLDVVEKRLDGHAGSAEHGRAAEDVRIFDDDVHERIVPCRAGRQVGRASPVPIRAGADCFKLKTASWA
jgi:hypothetical protein